MIKRFITNLICRAFGWGALFLCLFLGFASGAVVAIAGIVHLNASMEGDGSGYRSGVSYSGDSNMVTRADMARCSLMETGSTDPEPPEEKSWTTAIRQRAGYADETLLACSDELDRVAYDIARKKASNSVAELKIHPASVNKEK